jgi:hypothetical protein
LSNKILDEDFVGMVERLPPVGDKFGDNPVVLSAAGFGAVLAEVVHFAANSDEGSVGGFVMAVFWELFSGVKHCKNLCEKVSITLFTTGSIRRQINKNYFQPIGK